MPTLIPRHANRATQAHFSRKNIVKKRYNRAGQLIWGIALPQGRQFLFARERALAQYAGLV